VEVDLEAGMLDFLKEDFVEKEGEGEWI